MISVHMLNMTSRDERFKSLVINAVLLNASILHFVLESVRLYHSCAYGEYLEKIGLFRKPYSARRWSANSRGAQRKGEWSVFMLITFWHGRAVYIFFCNDGVTPLSRRVSM